MRNLQPRMKSPTHLLSSRFSEQPARTGRGGDNTEDRRPSSMTSDCKPLRFHRRFVFAVECLDVAGTCGAFVTRERSTPAPPCHLTVTLFSVGRAGIRATFIRDCEYRSE